MTSAPTFASLPDERAAAAPHAAALADDDRSLDNDAFLDAVLRTAAGLRAQGVGRGDVVAIRLPNTVHLVVALFAAWRLGAAATPINPFLTATEAGFQIDDAGSKVLVTADGATFEGTVTRSPSDLLTHAPDTAGSVASPSDLALLVYTSGTTGKPKGVMLDHANLTAMCEMFTEKLDLGSEDHSLLILPLFHVNAILVSTLNPLRLGGRVTMTGRFDPRTFFDLIERTRATFFSAVPTIYTMLLGLPAEVRPDTSSVRFAVCGAAPASRELLSGFESRYGFPLLEGYGLSECTCGATGNPLDGVRKPGTVGTALPGQSIRIVDGEGADVPTGEAGEVLLGGPNVMRGYLNRPEETAKTLVDGWLRTGDVSFLDEDGYLTLVDRAKDMIIRGGENIYPKEIETVVYQLDGVTEAAVVGRPDAKYGEVPVLYLSTRPDSELDEAAVLRHTAQSLAKYKQPVAVTFTQSLPKNPVGKLDKPALRRLDASAPTA